ncbi:MAG TPA: folylpolyglutamate synthase/dihydrofolate synthase family protein [Actinomycetes bacterium]|nr:folylpolyglutamate synthase/dihydrofolate synthase family protein [Actinomycetes bacterium]
MTSEGDDATRIDEAERLLALELELIRRAPESQIEPTLDRVQKALDLMGNPERAYPTIHVAGTNGKSSTAAMVDSLLTAYGVRTGRFTSPHLETLRERIRLDGELIDSGRLLAAWEDLASILAIVESDGGRQLTYFEVVTLLAFVAFADTPVSVGILEVGLGGRWDATNVIEPKVGVIMPIGLDHTDWLGDDLATIAGEKAGIIKPGQITVVAGQDPEATDVLVERSAAVGATLVREGVDYGLVDRQVAVGGQQLTIRGIGGVYQDVFLPLFGEHMARNAATALVAVEMFLGGGAGALDAEVVEQGFAAVSVPGRLEVIRRSPTVLLDVAHNPHGAAALVEAVAEAFSFQRLVGVVAVLGDKDAAGLLTELEPLLDEIVITQSSSPRAIDADDLGSLASEVFGSERVTVMPSLPDAIEAGVTAAESEGDLEGAGVLVTGSVTVVGEARTLLRRRR